MFIDLTVNTYAARVPLFGDGGGGGGYVEDLHPVVYLERSQVGGGPIFPGIALKFGVG